MRAVILAAGSGRRLRPVVGPWPKCLARLGGRTLLERQLDTLRACGIDEVSVVAGYRHEAVAAICDGAADIVLNPDHATTNSLYSLWLAREALAGGFVVLNSDVLFDAPLLARLLDSRHDDALLVAMREPGVRYSDEEMKVQVVDGCVAAIDKALPDAQADGENVGIAKFGPAGAAALCGQLDAIVARGELREWLPRAFDGFCRRRPLHVVDTAGRPWIEIDFPEDYTRACREVLPALAPGRHSAARPPRVTHDVPAITFGRILHRV